MAYQNQTVINNTFNFFLNSDSFPYQAIINPLTPACNPLTGFAFTYVDSNRFTTPFNASRNYFASTANSVSAFERKMNFIFTNNLFYDIL